MFKQFLSQIESGMLAWSKSHEQTFTLQRLNFRSGLKDIPIANFKSSNQVRNEDDETRKQRAEASKQSCQDYNDLKCPHPGDHDGKRHVCYYCWANRKIIEPHPGQDCPRDTRKKK